MFGRKIKKVSKEILKKMGPVIVTKKEEKNESHSA